MAVRTARPLARAGIASALLAGILALSACMPGPDPIEDFAGVPLVEPELIVEVDPEADEDEVGAEEGEEAAVELVELEVEEGEPRAVYLEEGARIAIVLWGSSTCPPVGTSMTVVQDAESGNAVRVEVAETPVDQPCTADFVPHTTVFWTPVDISTAQPLRIDIGGEEIILPIK